MKLYSDCTVRPMTVEPSKTNQAHNVWYQQLTPVQRLEVMENVDASLTAEKKLNACLNYIEDHLEEFQSMDKPKTRTQLRGFCSICGSFQAITANGIAEHGFSLQHGFRSNICHGSNRHHYGTIEAKNFLTSELNFHQEAIKNPELTDKEKRSKLGAIEVLKSRLEHWKESDAIEIDLDVEEAEIKKQRQQEAAAKKTERETKALEKEKRKQEREAKAQQKWNELCSNKIHQIEHRDQILVEWTATYSSRRELELDYRDRLSAYFDEQQITDVQDRIDISWSVVRRIRDSETKKQLHKW
ncbi:MULTISPECIES: hypothetical protein [Vibrio harveyi group]|uniref:Unknow n=1 Tax=Vibrio campbellii TaxID=680 RepID=A0AAC9SKJ9_9VIBR|nr:MULTISPECIES: hypothetical protein [Vibrio harveyi group]ARR10537.1 unknow [Vibrio campbellii]WHP52978.1 hypothetical protein QMY43_24980 [Vibrio parahaemolyticus]